MQQFIKLGKLVLNKNDIHRIVISQNKYFIYVINRKIEGSGWCFFGCGFGNLSTNISEIEICKIKHPNEYKIISDLIDNI